MFTGIVATVGRIARSEPLGGDLRLRIAAPGMDLGDVGLGDSIATNGVCLTVTRLEADGFWADVSNETVAHSTLAALPAGAEVNLEKALQLGGRLGGHLVSGHVDGVGEIVGCRSDGRSIRLTVRAPDGLAHYIAAKGSICVDGASLTVNAVRGAEFELNIVPHTARGTIIGGYRAGVRVNLEVDVIARYLERLLTGRGDSAPAVEANGALTLAHLERAGFVRR